MDMAGNRPDCVSCTGNNKRGKLLQCLHALCVECLEDHNNDRGEVACPECGNVTCASTSGIPQLQFLPDSDSDVSAAGGQNGGQQQQQLRKYCDECAEDAVAVATCSDCYDHFCADHARVHSASRRSYKHRVVSLSEQAAEASAATSSDKPSASSCPFHPSRKHSHYCLSCNKLLCDKCLAAKRHESHRHQVQPVQQAADEFRKSLSSKVAASFIGEESLLEVALSKAETAISGLQDETELVSAQISVFFDDFKQAIEARQQELLDKLDTLRSARLLPLEKQKQRLLSGLSSGQKVKHLTETCRSDTNLLKMAAWLKEATSDAISVAYKEVKPLSPGTLVFSPYRKGDMSDLVIEAGAVEDVRNMVPSAKSLMACPTTVSRGEELAVSINVRNATGDTFRVSQAHLKALKVEVAAKDNAGAAVECPVSTTSTTATTCTVVAKYKATKNGKFTVSAKTRSGHHLQGSPAEVNFIAPLQFDPAHCHADIQLSNGNKTATFVGATAASRSVYGNLKWTGRKGEIAIRIDRVASYDRHLQLHISSVDQPSLESYRSNTVTTFGFSSSARGSFVRSLVGHALGQPWQSGDVIHLALDCAKRTLAGRHERTGATETLTNVTGQCLCLCVRLSNLGDQVTIL